MNWLKKEWLQLLVLAAPFCAAALLWDRLPDSIPLHWDVHWQHDGCAGKPLGTLLLPLISIGFFLLGLVLPLLDLRMRAYDEETKASIQRAVRAILLAGTALLSCVELSVLAIALNVRVNLFLVVQIGVSLLSLVIGNLMTKLRPNHFIGIRVPWTLRSREVWMKTHRLAGRLLVAAASGLVFFAFVVPPYFYLPCVFIPVLVLVLIVSVVYAYRISKDYPL